MLITALPKNASDATFPGPPTRLIKQLFESSRADYALLERVAPVPPFFTLQYFPKPSSLQLDSSLVRRLAVPVVQLDASLVSR
jgi:hypothetical protein